jgi:hypothetical protein
MNLERNLSGFLDESRTSILENLNGFLENLKRIHLYFLSTSITCNRDIARQLH